MVAGFTAATAQTAPDTLRTGFENPFRPARPRSDRSRKVDATFRVSGKASQLRYADTGKTEPASCNIHSDRARALVALDERAPAPLFQVRGRAPISSTDDFTCDVTRDGQRFIVSEYLKPRFRGAVDNLLPSE